MRITVAISQTVEERRQQFLSAVSTWNSQYQDPRMDGHRVDSQLETQLFQVVTYAFTAPPSGGQFSLKSIADSHRMCRGERKWSWQMPPRPDSTSADLDFVAYFKREDLIDVRPFMRWRNAGSGHGSGYPGNPHWFGVSRPNLCSWSHVLSLSFSGIVSLPYSS